MVDDPGILKKEQPQHESCLKVTCMKFISITLFACLLGQPLLAQTITDIHQQTFSVDSLGGKKILIIILPLQQDTAAINQLLRFQDRFSDSVQVIGLVTSEVDTVIYQEAVARGVIITMGSMELDPSTERRSVLKWLSDLNKNNRASDPGVLGYKYFLSKHGRLYAELGPLSDLDGTLVENIVRSKVPGEH